MAIFSSLIPAKRDRGNDTSRHDSSGHGHRHDHGDHNTGHGNRHDHGDHNGHDNY